MCLAAAVHRIEQLGGQTASELGAFAVRLPCEQGALLIGAHAALRAVGQHAAARHLCHGIAADIDAGAVRRRIDVFLRRLSVHTQGGQQGSHRAGIRSERNGGKRLLSGKLQGVRRDHRVGLRRHRAVVRHKRFRRLIKLFIRQSGLRRIGRAGLRIAHKQPVRIRTGFAEQQTAAGAPLAVLRHRYTHPSGNQLKRNTAVELQICHLALERGRIFVLLDGFQRSGAAERRTPHVLGQAVGRRNAVGTVLDAEHPALTADRQLGRIGRRRRGIRQIGGLPLVQPPHCRVGNRPLRRAVPVEYPRPEPSALSDERCRQQDNRRRAHALPMSMGERPHGAKMYRRSASPELFQHVPRSFFPFGRLLLVNHAIYREIAAHAVNSAPHFLLIPHAVSSAGAITALNP